MTLRSHVRDKHCSELNSNVHGSGYSTRCELCDKSYIDQFNLDQHYEIVHEGSNMFTGYECYECNKFVKFHKSSELEIHIDSVHRKKQATPTKSRSSPVSNIEPMENPENPLKQ